MTLEFLVRATGREIMSVLSPEHATDEHSLVCFDVLGGDRDGLYRFTCSCGESPVLLAEDIHVRTGRTPGAVADRLTVLGRRSRPA